MQNKKKILFFLLSGVGGAERITVTIAKMLPLDTFEVKFVIVDKSKGNISDFIPDNYSIEYVLLSNIWCFGTSRIYQIMKQEQPHCVFCSVMYLNCRVAICAHLLGIKCILRNCNYMKTQRYDKKLLCKLSYPYADIVISQQEEMVEDIVTEIGIDKNKVVCMYNPLDISTIHNKLKEAINPFENENNGNKTKRFVWVARFNKNKGQDIAIKAFSLLHNDLPDSHLYLIGKYDKNSDYYVSIMNLIKQENLQNHVHIPGFDSNPYRWILYSDCFVLPSRIEGLPNTLIESQYLGKPAAAAKCIPIIERIVSEGVNGYCAEKEDPKSLAEAMLKAVNLGTIEMTYKSARQSDFISLFC